jgi:release factor glutamine methyltransferase
MSIKQWLHQATTNLAQAGIETARLDALVLLEDKLGSNRAQILAHLEQQLAADDQNVLNQQVVRRMGHEPLAYIRGYSEFYGRKFIVSPAVLEPRPESETMIEMLKTLALELAAATPNHDKARHPMHQQLNAARLRIADIGSGSGALGITAHFEVTGSQVSLYEIDPAALAVSHRNVVLHNTALPVIASDLLAAAPSSYDVLLSNLPYVPDDITINSAAWHEPKRAIFGGTDGLTIYRQLFSELHNLQQPPLYVLTECFPWQQTKLSSIAADSGYQLLKTDDFIGLYAYQFM